METIEKLIENKTITKEQIYDYLNSIGYEVVKTEYLNELEKTSLNHPG